MIKVNKVLNKYLKEKNSSQNPSKIKAASDIKAMLSMVDLNVEVVPENSIEMLTRLISTLKGKPLTNEEKELIIEITLKN